MKSFRRGDHSFKILPDLLVFYCTSDKNDFFRHTTPSSIILLILVSLPGCHNCVRRSDPQALTLCKVGENILSCLQGSHQYYLARPSIQIPEQTVPNIADW